MAGHGRYKIIRKVADGGMAEIFLAVQLGREGFQKPVILKRIHTSIYADPQFRNMFIDEAHICMGLSHSNIVQILDLGSSGGRYFLVLELVDGWDLGRILHRAGAARLPLPRELALYMLAEVCQGLAYAHAKTDGETPLGIVHRDVSPHNVLISDEGEVKLTDFGIAKAMNKREHTGAGVVKGKVAFMSPEQALGRAIDARSDIFALGTMLYLLLTGQRPFEGGTDIEVLLRVQKADFKPPEYVRPGLEPELSRITTRAMRLDPDERYQSVDEMQADIEAVMRTVFRPVGQSDLKRWVAELARRDGMPTISKAAGISSGARTGSGEIEGKHVVLMDEESDDVGEQDPTSLAVVDTEAGTVTPQRRDRLARGRTAPVLPLPADATEATEARISHDLALPVPEEEGPARYRNKRRSGRRGLVYLLGGALVVVGAGLGGSYFGARVDSEPGATPAANPEAPAAIAEPQPSEPPAPAAAVAATPAPSEPTTAQGAAGAVAKEGQPGGAGEVHAAKREPEAASSEGARDPAKDAARKPRAAAPPEEPPASRRGVIELKNLLYPDPSQLPPAPIAPATSKAAAGGGVPGAKAAASTTGSAAKTEGLVPAPSPKTSEGPAAPAKPEGAPAKTEGAAAPPPAPKAEVAAEPTRPAAKEPAPAPPPRAGEQATQ